MSKSKAAVTTQNIVHPKYNIAKRLRDKYGEFEYDKKGVAELAAYCNIPRLQTVKDWMKIEAGSSSRVSHLIISKVLEFFQLQNESQLFTKQHKELLKAKPVAA